MSSETSPKVRTDCANSGREPSPGESVTIEPPSSPSLSGGSCSPSAVGEGEGVGEAASLATTVARGV
jgi:hypothetical protein